MKYYIVTLFLLSGLLFPASSMAQILYENYDNIVTINVPGIDASKLIVTAESGTIVHKEKSQWIARPNGEIDSDGMRKNFVISVSTSRNGKNEKLSSKAYRVGTTYIIDYFDEKTFRINKTKLNESQGVLLKVDGIERICFYIYADGTEDSFQCGFLFAEKNIELLAHFTKTSVFYLITNEAWNEFGQKIKLSPIKLTLEQ